MSEKLKVLKPAKQVAAIVVAHRAHAVRARDERVMDQLAHAVEVGMERGEINVQIHRDDLSTARRLLDAEGYVWTEPEPDDVAMRNGNIGATQTLKIDLTKHKDPIGP